MRHLTLAALIVPIVACNVSTAPPDDDGRAVVDAQDGELRPLVQQLVLPPSLSRCNPDAPDTVATICGAADQCTRFSQGVFLCREPSPQLVQSFAVRNIGTSTVTVRNVAFVGANPASFTGAALDVTALGADDVSSLAFTYFTPDVDAPYSVDLVITSDAAVNPTLTVPVSTLPFAN
jgi:hypothetical protein